MPYGGLHHGGEAVTQKVWDIRDGKLVHFRQFIDTVKFAEVVPVPAAI